MAASGVLHELDRAELDEVGDVTCAVRTDGWVIHYVNPAWRAFALANGAQEAWGPGAALLDGISDPLRELYRERLSHVAATGEPWEYPPTSEVSIRQAALLASLRGTLTRYVADRS